MSCFDLALYDCSPYSQLTGILQGGSITEFFLFLLTFSLAMLLNQQDSQTGQFCGLRVRSIVFFFKFSCKSKNPRPGSESSTREAPCLRPRSVATSRLSDHIRMAGGGGGGLVVLSMFVFTMGFSQ